MTAKQNKPRNNVAKNAHRFNRNKRHIQKPITDYVRKPKHKKEPENE